MARSSTRLLVEPWPRWPYWARRERLEQLLRTTEAPLVVMPSTRELAAARARMSEHVAAGIEG